MGVVLAGAGWWRVSRVAAQCAFRVVRVGWVGKRSQQFWLCEGSRAWVWCSLMSTLPNGRLSAALLVHCRPAAWGYPGRAAQDVPAALGVARPDRQVGQAELLWEGRKEHCKLNLGGPHMGQEEGRDDATGIPNKESYSYPWAYSAQKLLQCPLACAVLLPVVLSQRRVVHRKGRSHGNASYTLTSRIRAKHAKRLCHA